MNYYSTDYIGATGLHPVFEYVDDASNVISNRITNTSNDLAINIQNTSNILNDRITYTSNQNYKYTSNLTHKYSHTNNGPFDFVPYVLGSMPPLMQPVPINAGAIETYSIATQFRRPNLSILFNELTDKTLKGELDLIEKLLQDSEIRTNLNELQSMAWQEFSISNKAQSSANSAAVGAIQTEIWGLQMEMFFMGQVLAINSAATAFNTIFNLGSFVSGAIKFFSRNNDGDTTAMKTFNEYLWYSFHKDPLPIDINHPEPVILESLTPNQDLNGLVYNTSNEITRGVGNSMNYVYEYNSAGLDNYINVLENNNDKIKEYLLLFETSFSLSFKIYFKSLSINNILRIYDDNNSYLEILYNGGSLYFRIYASNGDILLQKSVSYSFVLHQFYHIIFSHGKTQGLNVYIDKIQVGSLNYNLNTIPTDWNTLNSSTLKFRVLENTKDIKIEDFRILPVKISQEDVDLLYQPYVRIETGPELLRNELMTFIDGNTENILNTSNWIGNNNTFTSNYINNNYVNLATNITNTSNWIRNNNTFTSNYINNNYVNLATNITNTSNWIKNNNTFTSNYINNNYVNLATNITNTSNWIKNNNTFTSNYINNNYVNLATNITNTSNWIKIFRDDINLKTDGLWKKSGNIVYNLDDNIGIGKTDANYKLDVNGVIGSIGLEVKPELQVEYMNINNFILNYDISKLWLIYDNTLKNKADNDTAFLPEPTTYWNNEMLKYTMIYYKATDIGSIKVWNENTITSFIIGMNAKLDFNTGSVCDMTLFKCKSGSYSRYEMKAQIFPTETQQIKVSLKTTYNIYSTFVLNIDSRKEHFYQLCIKAGGGLGGQFRIYVDGVLANKGTFTDDSYDIQELWIGGQNPVGTQNLSIFHYIDIMISAPDNTIWTSENVWDTQELNRANVYYNISKQLNNNPNSVFLGKTYIENLYYDQLIKNGEKYYTNSIANFVNNPEIPQENQITIPDNARRQLTIGNDILNSTNNLINETGNAGYLYYSDVNTTTTAQVKSISYDELANKPASFPPSQHTHAISDITDLQTTLNSKVSSQWTTSGTTIYYNDGNVGIGTSTPESSLEVNGWVVSRYTLATDFSRFILKNNDGSIWCQFRFGNTANTTLGSGNFGIFTGGAYRLVILYGSGNIGIGNITPQHKLDVSGNINYTGLLLKNGTDVLQYLETSNLNTSNYVLNTSNAISNRISGLNNVSLATIGNIVNTSNLNTSNYVLNVSNTKQNTLTASTDISINGLLVNNSIRLLKNFSQHPDGTFALDKPNIVGGKLNILTDGKVGINKPAPEYLLDVGGDINYTGILRKSGIDVLQYLETSNLNTSNYVLNTSNAISNRISGLNNVSLATIGNIANASNLNTSNYVLNISNTKQNTLTAGTNITIVGNLISSTGTSQWTTSGSSIYYNGGNVGVGTTNPQYAKLDDVDNILVGPKNNESGIATVYFGTPYNSSQPKSAIIAQGINSFCRSKIHFCLDSSTNWNTRIVDITDAKMTIEPLNGNVGIGTTSPAYKLDVAGDINISTGSSFRINGVPLSTSSSQWITSQSQQNLNTYIQYNGIVNINGGANYACDYNRMTAGSLTIGNTLTNYGLGTTGWNTNTAGLLMECADNTEIAVHDNATRLISLISYEGVANRIQIGRKMEASTISTTTIWGNVGIGTASPSQKLEVLGHIKVQNTADTWQSAFLMYNNDASRFCSFNLGGTGNNVIGNGGFGIYMNNDFRFHIAHDTGNVGIGVLNTGYKLEVNGTFRLLNGFSQHPDGTFALDKPNIVGGRVHCLVNGNFGINKPAPDYTLDVGGDINISGTLRKGGVDILAVSKLVNQHYISSTFYVGADTLRTYSIDVSPLASFGNTAARIYDLNISGVYANYGSSTEVIGSYRIFHSSYSGGKLKKITLYEQSPASAPLNVNISNGSIVTFNTVNSLQVDIYTSVSIVN